MIARRDKTYEARCLGSQTKDLQCIHIMRAIPSRPERYQAPAHHLAPTRHLPISSSCPSSARHLPVIYAIQLLPSSSCPSSSTRTIQLPPAIQLLPVILSSSCLLSLCLGLSFSSRSIVLVEVARVEEVSSSGKVESRALGSCHQGGFSVVPSQRAPSRHRRHRRVRDPAIKAGVGAGAGRPGLGFRSSVVRSVP